MSLLQTVWRWPEAYLDRTPMYQVVLQVLLVIYGCAIAAATFGLIGFAITELLATGMVVLVSALLTSFLAARVTHVPAQHLSSVITALILGLLILPTTVPFELYGAAMIAVLAIASKYVLIYRKQHVVNPVAAGLVMGSILGFGGAAWWVANPVLFLPLLIGGWLVVVKMRRVDMVTVFIAVGFIGYVVSQWSGSQNSTDLLITFFTSYPVLFLGFFMLTEPFTMPSRTNERLIYAVLVGGLLALPPVGPVVFSPELALLLGNVVAFPWSLRQKLMLTLQQKREVSPRIWEFTFSKPSDMRFIAGQYLEWMLPHSSDKRGIRRYFTIASAPEEPVLRLALKIPDQASTFKSALGALPVGGEVVASQRAGDFILPADPKQKIGWIAGGIGVTPFVSQAASLQTRGEVRDIFLLYAVATATDTAYYQDLVRVARVVPVVGSGEVPVGGRSGFVNETIIRDCVPDFAERLWYVSGPPPMVTAAKVALGKLGVSEKHIKTDFFPGLA